MVRHAHVAHGTGGSRGGGRRFTPPPTTQENCDEQIIVLQIMLQLHFYCSQDHTHQSKFLDPPLHGAHVEALPATLAVALYVP